MIDIAAIAADADLDEIDLRAADWGIQRLWRTTIAAVDSLFYEHGTPWSLRLWARNLAHVRERTVLENHLQRLMSDFWELPVPGRLRAAYRDGSGRTSDRIRTRAGVRSCHGQGSRFGTCFAPDRTMTAS